MQEMPETNPIRPTDDEARALARRLLDHAAFGALGVIDPATGAPMVTRVAVGTDAAGRPVTLVSDLSAHTRALKAEPACSLLVGEPGPRGDPLTHPRLTLQARARFVRKGEGGHDALRSRWLAGHPKSTLYVDFADFSFVLLDVEAAHLNGGFGRAFVLGPGDLGLAEK
jgi:putative heme iron utilization protein